VYLNHRLKIAPPEQSIRCLELAEKDKVGNEELRKQLRTMSALDYFMTQLKWF
jgi:hypothetical protein